MSLWCIRRLRAAWGYRHRALQQRSLKRARKCSINLTITAFAHFRSSQRIFSRYAQIAGIHCFTGIHYFNILCSGQIDVPTSSPLQRALRIRAAAVQHVRD